MNTCKTSPPVLLQTARTPEKPKTKNTMFLYLLPTQPPWLPQRLLPFSATRNQRGKRPKCCHLLHPLWVLFTVLLHSTSRVTNTWILTHDGERYNTRSFICTPWGPLSLGGHPPFILYHMSKKPKNIPVLSCADSGTSFATTFFSIYLFNSF